MSKKVLLLVFALAFSFALLGPAFAQQRPAAKPAEQPTVKPAEQPKAVPAEQPQAKPAEKPKVASLTGKVKAVDEAAKAVTVVVRKKDVVVKVADDTTITRGKAKKALGDVKAGATVTIRYTKEGEEMTAKSISIAVPKPAKNALAKQAVKARPPDAAKPAEGAKPAN